MVVRLDNPVVEETRKATFGWLFCWGNIPSIFEGWINIVNGEEAMKLDEVLSNSNVHVDEKGREWEIVARHPGDGSTHQPTFLATWVNRVGYKNVALFVRFQSGLVDLTSIDGPFSTPEMREAWGKENGYK